MSIFQLWILSVIFKINAGTSIVLLILTITLLILAVIYVSVKFGDNNNDRVHNEPNIIKLGKRVFIVTFMVFVLHTATPSREDGIWIATGYIATNANGIAVLTGNAVNTFLENFTDKGE